MSRRRNNPPPKTGLRDYLMLLAMVVVPVVLILFFASGAWAALLSGIERGSSSTPAPVPTIQAVSLPGDCVQTLASPFTLECTTTTASPDSSGH